MSTNPRRLQLYLCHAPVDKPAVRHLYRQLQNDGISAWFDEEDLEFGSERSQAIDNAIKEADVILVCLSKPASATEGYIHKEIKLALDKADLQPEGAITIIPLRLDNTPLPYSLQKLVPLDLFEEGGYARLLKSLRKLAERRGLEVAPATLTASPSNFTFPPYATSPSTSPTTQANSSPSTSADAPKVLSFAERSEIIKRLLACPSLSSSGSRETIISSLPPQIANSIARSSQSTMDISNLLTTCFNYPNGLQDLLEVLAFFEQGSIPFRELQRYIDQII